MGARRLGVCRSVDGVDRALSRYRAIQAEIHIQRHALENDRSEDAPLRRANREAPDHAQLRGAPVIVTTAYEAAVRLEA
jgi:hypothetical protein